jgi:hypothetical protein
VRKIAGSNLVITINRTIAVAFVTLFIASCAPEVGSDAWCEDMVNKSKGDWTANEAAEFAKSCIFKSYDDEE